MVASGTHRRNRRLTNCGPLARGLLIALCFAWPAVGRANDALAYDPFEDELSAGDKQQAYDPFEVRQVDHVVPPTEKGQAGLQKRPAVQFSDPTVTSARPAPRAQGNAAPFSVAVQKRTSRISRSASSRPAHVRTAQLELPHPSDQDEDEGYAKAAQDWRPKPLDQLTINIAEPAGVTPRDYAADRPQQHWCCDPTASRCWPMLTYQWAATCLCYQPLYFEEINLERYGYGCPGCLQSAASAAHFFGTVPILPYCMAVNCPGECNYALGQYRPGSCAPWRTECPGPNCVGGLAEAGTVVGLVLLIP
jgi:hypothetical protein